MDLHDVTRALGPTTPVYPGDPGVTVTRLSKVEDGAQFNLSVVTTGSHAGTHVDPPLHFFENGAGVDALPLDILIGPARLVVCHGGEIDREYLEGAGLSGVTRVIFKGAGAITEEAALRLVETGVRLVGVDTLSVDGPSSTDYPAHRILLGAGVVIIEGLDLTDVGPGGYELICLPMKIEGCDGAPARVALRGPVDAR